MENCKNQTVEEFVDSFRQENNEEGLRVFVAGGSRSGNDEVYVKECYNLGKKIAKMDFKLDFGLSSSGIMGAVARGVIDGWNKRQCKTPIKGITTKEYYSLYQTDEILSQIEDVIVAQTLEERKQKLLNADFVVFAPGGVGTLDELAYDCVAMQDGFLHMKPFILYNIDGYFHHLVEFLKSMSAKGFSNPVPFIVVDDSFELGVVFRLLKCRYKKGRTADDTYSATRQLIYELPYFIKRKLADPDKHIEVMVQEMSDLSYNGTAEERSKMANDIEQAYLEKEISRMYDRLAKAGRDTAVVSDKLTKLRQMHEVHQEKKI